MDVRQEACRSNGFLSEKTPETVRPSQGLWSLGLAVFGPPQGDPKSTPVVNGVGFVLIIPG